MHSIHYIQHLRQQEGGVVRAALDLATGLARSGTQVTLVTRQAEAVGSLAEDIEGRLRVVPCHLPRASPLARFAPATRQELTALLRQGDVLHLHTLWDPLNLAFSKLATELGVPYVVSTHGMLDDSAMRFKPVKKQVYLALVGRKFLREAYRLHATAEGESRQVLKRVPGARTFVAPLSVDLDMLQNLPGPELARQAFPRLAQPGPKVLFLSRLHPIKGIELLIDAMAEIPEEVAPHLVIAGPGDPRYVEQVETRIAARGLASRTSLVGMVSGELKLSLYQACDLLVHPSQQENFGLVLAEAMACGTPVLTTDQVDPAAELEAGGALIVPRTVEALREAIATALGDLPALAERGTEGRRFVFEWLDIERVMGLYNQLYRDAAASAARPRP